MQVVFLVWQKRLRESVAGKFLEMQVAEPARSVPGDSGLENASSSVVLPVFSNLQSVIVGVRGVFRAPSASSMQLSVEPR